MTLPGQSIFSAADSAVGYLYQVRIALLWALRRLKTDSEFIISLETLDDVAFESTGARADELLQTKHHRNRAASLADASVDLWKTLRVWFAGTLDGTIPAGASLHLLTTATASPGSIAAYLRIDNRDENAALRLMEATARTSQNETNAAAYAAFLSASETVRRTLLQAVVVIDSAPSAVALSDDFRAEVFWAADKGNLDAFVERLEGWWLRRCVKQLSSSDSKDRILAAEIEAQMSDLREQFKQDSLPIDDDLLNFDLDATTYAAHSEYLFVRQLGIIKAGKVRVAAAVRDYYRAFEQRSRWLRDDLLLIGNLDVYEKRLVEAWELVFQAMKDELGENIVEDEKQRAARAVLKWAEGISISIRPSVTEPFVTRGSLHMLADKVRIGWHPDFRDKLAALLSSGGPA